MRVHPMRKGMIYMLEIGLGLFGLLLALYLSYGYLAGLWYDRHVMVWAIDRTGFMIPVARLLPIAPGDLAEFGWHNPSNWLEFILSPFTYEMLTGATEHDHSGEYVVSFDAYFMLYIRFAAVSLAVSVLIQLVAFRSVRYTLVFLASIRAWHFLLHGLVFAAAFHIGDVFYCAMSNPRLITLQRVTSYSMGPAHMPYRIAGVISLAVGLNALVQYVIWKGGWMGSRFPASCCRACGYEMGALRHCPECGPEVNVKSLVVKSLVCPPLRLALIVPLLGIIIAFLLLLSPLWLPWVG